MSLLGPKTEVAALRRDVCFTSDSGHWTEFPEVRLVPRSDKCFQTSFNLARACTLIKRLANSRPLRQQRRKTGHRTRSQKGTARKGTPLVNERHSSIAFGGFATSIATTRGRPSLYALTSNPM
jgi:hypothetical protein